MSILWRDLPSLPQAVGGQFVGTLAEHLIVAGGTLWQGCPWEGGQKMWTREVYALAADKDSWSVVGALPELLAYGAAVRIGNRMLCLGGQTPEGASASCYELHWDRGEVVSSRLPDLPEPSMMMAAAATRDRIYLAGGLNGAVPAAPSSAFWTMAIAEVGTRVGGWNRLPSWPGVGRFFPQMAADATTVYLAGGSDLVDGCMPPVRRFLQDAFAWNKGKWITLPKLPAPAQAGLAAMVDGEYFVFGGNDGSLVKREAELKDKHPGFRTSIWSLTRGRWRDAGQLPGSFVTTGLVQWNGELVIAGGEDRPGHRTARVIAGHYSSAITQSPNGEIQCPTG